MIVSLCVVAYNEEKVLNKLLEDIKSQDYDHTKMEIVLIDSMSTDSTKEIMNDFQQQEKDFKKIQVLDNPGKKQAAGWNVAINNFSGDVMIRVDAHASIPREFVRKNVEILETGEMVSGGPRPNIIDESTPWKETLLLAEQSMFGSSMASYRRSQKKQYVKSLFHGAYRREVLEKVGGFDEQLGRTEDNEFHYRIRKAGYKICYSPGIIWKWILGCVDIKGMSGMSGSVSFCSICICWRYYNNFCTCSWSSYFSCQVDVGSL